MAFPTKPSSPALQSSHGLAADLVGAWLFTEGTGQSVQDYSGLGHHLSGTGYTNGSWGTDGAGFLRVNTSRLTTGTSTSDFNHVAGEAWTISLLLRNNGAGLGTFRRIASRPNNVPDLAFQGNDNFGFGFFNGSAWVNQLSSAVSGACEWWHITHAANNAMKVYRNAVEVYSGTQAIGATGKLDFAAPPGTDLPADEFFGGDFAAILYHRRALSANEVSSHYSAPFDAFTPPAAPAQSGPPDTPVWVGGIAPYPSDFRRLRTLPRFNGSPRFV